MANPHQRLGSISNAHVGREFENLAQEVLALEGVVLEKNFKVLVGLAGQKKVHAFDLGCEKQKILVECKSHRWTAPNDNVPSAKLTVWNEAMYYFLVAPPGFRKIMFVLRHLSGKRGETLAEYYIRTYKHLIPDDVEIWEYDEEKTKCNRLI